MQLCSSQPGSRSWMVSAVMDESALERYFDDSIANVSRGPASKTLFKRCLVYGEHLLKWFHVFDVMKLCHKISILMKFLSELKLKLDLSC